MLILLLHTGATRVTTTARPVQVTFRITSHPQTSHKTTSRSQHSRGHTHVAPFKSLHPLNRHQTPTLPRPIAHPLPNTSSQPYRTNDSTNTTQPHPGSSTSSTLTTPPTNVSARTHTSLNTQPPAHRQYPLIHPYAPDRVFQYNSLTIHPPKLRAPGCDRPFPSVAHSGDRTHLTSISTTCRIKILQLPDQGTSPHFHG